MLGSFAVSCGLALLAARIVFAKRESVFEPGATTWRSLFFDKRPPSKPLVVTTLELKDGRRLAGRIGSFTAELEDSRELGLVGPLFASPNGRARLEPMGGDFIVLREEQIATITGVYVEPKAESTAPATPERRTGGA